MKLFVIIRDYSYITRTYSYGDVDDMCTSPETVHGSEIISIHSDQTIANKELKSYIKAERNKDYQDYDGTNNDYRIEEHDLI